MFSLTRFISTPWIFSFCGFSDVSYLDNHLRDLLRSWGSFSLFMSQTFLEEAPKLSANFLVVPAWSGLICPIRNTRGYTLLSRGIWVSHRSSGVDYFWGILTVPKFFLIWGFSRIYRKDCFAIASNVPDFLFHALCCSRLNTKKGYSDFFPYLQRYSKCIRISSCSARRRGKVVVI